MMICTARRGRIRIKTQRRPRFESAMTRPESTEAAPKIQIPHRIERGPVDILTALESTVKRNPSMPAYKYIDDPYLLPVTRAQMRSYALARESGRKAAMWIHKEHAELFEKDIAVPEIPAFQPPEMYTEASQVSEEKLEYIINNRMVPEAMQVYNLLQGNVSTKTKLALFELLCFYNCMEAMPSEFVEFRWIMKRNVTDRMTWTTEPIMDELFLDLIKQGPEEKAAAYNAMICGMAKCRAASRAWEMFSRGKEEGIPYSVTTYNYMLGLIAATEATDAKREEMLLHTFREMSSLGIRPDVNTLNSALKTILTIQPPRCVQLARRMFTEFQNLRIEPSLAAYAYTLLIFSKQGGNPSIVFEQILELLKDKEFEIHNEHDTRFFTLAMEMAASEYNLELANKLHSIYLKSKNYKFINKNFDEVVYFRNYLLVHLQSLDMDKFFKLYNELTPTVYIPEPNTMEQILQSLRMNPPETIHKHLPTIWSHVIQFNLTETSDPVLKLLEMTDSVNNILDDTERVKFAKQALTVWETLMEMHKKQQDRLLLDVKIIGYVALILARADFLNDSVNVVEFLSRNVSSLTGYMSKDQANELCDYYIDKKHTEGAMLLVEYLANSMSDDAMVKARQLVENLSLDKAQKAKILNLLGPDAFETEQTVLPKETIA